MPLYSIGQFSRMTRLSVKRLRQYDEEGVLIPAHVDPVTRYRYYRHDQVERAEMIRLLNSLEMPRKEIKKILAQSTPEAMLTLLEQHRLKLADELAARQRSLAHVESLLKTGQVHPNYAVQLEDIPDLTVAAVRLTTRLGNIAQDIAQCFSKLAAAMVAASVQPVGPPRLVYHDVIEQGSAGDIEVCIPVPPASKIASGAAIRTLVGGTVATTAFKGRYDFIGPAYHALATWITKSGYQVVDPPREIYLNDPQQVPAEELLTRIEFPVKQTT